jgi:hypothetical protein
MRFLLIILPAICWLTARSAPLPVSSYPIPQETHTGSGYTANDPLAPIAARLIFEDITDKLGLAAPLQRWRWGHGIAVGDCTGNGLPDLYVGAFADRPLYAEPAAPLPNMLFFNTNGRFTLATESEVNLNGKHARTTMALFADLNNDGRLDLIVGNHVNKRSYRSVLFENLGQGRFRDATPNPPAWLAAVPPRNVSVLDFDRDGLLDLIFTDGTYGAPQTGTGRLYVMRNHGDWSFTDVTEQYGFPLGRTTGLGTAIADVNNDDILDIFVAHENRLFVSNPDGKYRAFDDEGLFVRAEGQNWPCGVAFGDLNGDDLLDLVITIHGKYGAVYVYRNTGIQNGLPRFKEIYRAIYPRISPVTGSLVKAAQVAACDIDNDGRLDIATSILYADANGRACPYILRNLGNDMDGVPHFEVPPIDRIMCYYAPGALVDLDRDGRMDLILPAWYPEQDNLALRNVTPGGNWLLVQVNGARPGFNPMGIGAIIRAYPPGKAGQATTQLARYDLSIGNGYSSGEEAIAHLGLGAAAECDLVITWQGVRKVLPRVKANQSLTVTFNPDEALQ